jgi:hypothetical protein
MTKVIITNFTVIEINNTLIKHFALSICVLFRQNNVLLERCFYSWCPLLRSGAGVKQPNGTSLHLSYLPKFQHHCK